MASYHAMTPAPISQPPTPQKKANSGCLIAVIVVGALVALVCLVGVVVSFVAAQSPEGKKAMSLMGRGISAAAKAMNAPGTPELRALGCPEAMVMDPEEVMELVGEFIDAGPPRGADERMKTVVICQGSFSLPTCDEVADAYRTAKGVTPGPFTVTVKRKGSRKSECEKDFE